MAGQLKCLRPGGWIGEQHLTAAFIVSDATNYIGRSPMGGTSWGRRGNSLECSSIHRHFGITCTSSVFFQPFNDSVYFPYAYCNGSSTLTYYMAGQVVTPIGLTGATYAWTNQGSCHQSLKQTNGIWTFDCPAHNGDTVRTYDTALPSVPFTEVFRLSFANVQNTNDGDLGIVLRESATGKLITAAISSGTGSTGTATLHVNRWTNFTTFSATTACGASIGTYPLAISVSVASGATGLITIQFSTDGGFSFPNTCYSAAKNSFFTTGPDNIGIQVNNNTSGNPDTMLTLISIN